MAQFDADVDIFRHVIAIRPRGAFGSGVHDSFPIESCYENIMLGTKKQSNFVEQCYRMSSTDNWWGKNDYGKCLHPASTDVIIKMQFMRSSAEALCPLTKYVQDPTDTQYSIAEVYFNICGFVDATEEQRYQVWTLIRNILNSHFSRHVIVLRDCRV